MSTYRSTTEWPAGCSPAITQADAPESFARRARCETDARPKRILVADDDSLVCGSVCATLEDAGYQVKAAVDGEAAWGALLASGFDLLVTDDLMPKVSGLALVRRIRVADMVLLVVVTSERLDAADVAIINRDPWSRFDRLVHKPFTTSEILALVNGMFATD